MASSRRHGSVCYRRHFDISLFGRYLYVKGIMIRITYGDGGYDPTKPNDNIVEEEWLPDPPDPPPFPPEENHP